METQKNVNKKLLQNSNVSIVIYLPKETKYTNAQYSESLHFIFQEKVSVIYICPFQMPS